MTELILIRHAQTEANSQKRYSGITDVKLNSTGKQEAKKLSAKLKDEKIDKIYTSDLSRCIETARLAGVSDTLVKLEDLREVNFGIFENLTYDEMKNKYPHEVVKWAADWENYQPPQGESFKEMSRRVLVAVEKIINKSYQKVAIVSHYGCISAILAHYIWNSLDACMKFKVENASISRVCFDKKSTYLKSLNE